VYKNIKIITLSALACGPLQVRDLFW